MTTVKGAESAPFSEWAILELMGHRRFAGLVSDVELFGSRMVRIDIPSEPPATQFYGPSAVYCVTPTDEATCRAFARQANKPAPIHRWEIEPPITVRSIPDAFENDDAPF